MRVIEKCDLCNSEEYKLLISQNKAMASDSSNWNEGLNKIECTNCRLVRNKFYIDANIIENHYKNNYKLSTKSQNSEPIFFLENGEKITRSQAIFEWIIKSLNNRKNFSKANINSILEVGCSDGLLLEKMSNYFSKSNVEGIEPNASSVSCAKEIKLHVTQGLFEDLNGKKYDLIYSIAVIEHVDSPSKFFSSITNLLNKNGLLILVQPSMQLKSYDIFFADHIHHFSFCHMNLYGKKNGLEEIYSGLNSLVSPFSLHIYKKTDQGHSLTNDDFKLCKSYQKIDSLEFFKNQIVLLNQYIKDVDECFIYGVGEKFSFFHINSELGN